MRTVNLANNNNNSNYANKYQPHRLHLNIPMNVARLFCVNGRVVDDMTLHGGRGVLRIHKGISYFPKRGGGSPKNVLVICSLLLLLY